MAMEDADLLLLEGSVYSNILTTGWHLVVCVCARLGVPNCSCLSTCTAHAPHKHASITTPMPHSFLPRLRWSVDCQDECPAQLSRLHQQSRAQE